MSAPVSTSQFRALRALRKATEIAIKFDPRTIILVPHVRVKKSGGVYDYEAQTPRPAQTFTIEPVGATLSGITGTSGGKVANEGGAQTRSWNYRLIGRHDSQMAIGDTWRDGDSEYRIISLEPKNDYEKVGVVSAFGSDPNYGN